jgi:uncharacterized RDD family membrane protein YckC
VINDVPAEQPEFAGLVTRTLAFAIDAAIINAVALATGVVVALVFSVLPASHDLETLVVAAGGVAFLCWAVGYFVTFWATTGQTPGNRVMHIRVLRLDGTTLKPRGALLRLVALFAAVLPLGAGLVPILFSAQRRGFHDFVARTTVPFRTESPSREQAAYRRPAPPGPAPGYPHR